jgi:hypothetical protein
MSLPQTRSNPQMNAMRRYSQVRDPRIEINAITTKTT